MTIPEAEIKDGRQVKDNSPKHQYPTNDVAKQDRKTQGDEEDERDSLIHYLLDWPG